MEKIYSRPHFKKLRKKHKIIICVFLLAVISIILLNKVIYPLFSKKCIYKARELVTKISNEETEEIMKEYTYQDLMSIQEDSEGNVTFIESNVVLINQIKANIVNSIQERFSETKNATIEIVAGSLTGSRLLSNFGPRIKIKVIPSGTINSTLETEFYAVGVNQSLHRIYINLNCTVSIISPFETVSQSVENKVLLSESVIVGETPTNYYHIDTMTSSDQLNLLD